jgi:hypothetical protein
MLIYTAWKSRQLSPDQINRMMDRWAKIEAAQAENPSLERVCWYMFGDGSGGFIVNKATDVEAASAFGLELSLAMSEFLEFDSKIVLDLDSAMPAIMKATERINS